MREKADLRVATCFGDLGVHQESNDEPVETQDFGKNEDENHADEQPRLLSSSSDTSITDDTDCKA